MFLSLSLSLSLSLLSSLPSFYNMFMFYDKTAYIIREMHVRTLALLCYFSDSSLASLCYAKVTSLVAEPMRWGANPPSLFLSLSLFLSWPKGSYYATYASVLYGVTDYYSAHTAPRLQALCRGYNAWTCLGHASVPYC